MGVRFASSAKSKNRGINLPRWAADSEALSDQIRSEWAKRLGWLMSKNPNTSAYDKLALFKKTITFTTTKYLKTHSNTSLNNDINSLSIATSLLRLVTATTLDLERIHSFLHRHPNFDNYITITDDNIIYNKLNNYMKQLLKDAIPHEDDDDFSMLDDINVNDDVNVINNKILKSHNASLLKKFKVELPSNRRRIHHIRANEAGALTSDPHKMANIYKDHWEKIWSERTNSPTSEVLNNYFKDYDKTIKIIPTLPTIDQITDTIKATNNSCAGPDGIPFAFYRNLLDITPTLILDTLTLLSTNTPPPEGFNHARLFLIPKSLSTIVDDTRPISVTNTDNRIIAKCMASTLTPTLQDFLDKAQQAFTKGRLGSILINDITSRYYHNLQKKKQHYILFMDTRKAFDSIDHNFIIKILRHINMPTWVVNTVINLLTDVLVSPVVSEKVDTTIPIKRGVKQGCPLSPLLFILCYDILITKMNKLNTTHDYNTYAFADDLAIDSPNLDSIMVKMKMINVFAGVSGLGLNLKKTQILTTLPPTKNDYRMIDNSKWKMIKFTDNYKYLGVLMGSKISTIDIFKPVLTKFKDRLFRYSGYLKKCSIQHRIIIFNVFLLSLFSYLAFFYIIPFDEIITPVRELCRKHIIPFHGGGFGYVHLLEGRKNFGFHTPLKDLWATSTALLIARLDPHKHHGNKWCLIDGMLHVHYAKWNSLIINEHKAHMLMHYLHNYGENDDEGLIDTDLLSEDLAKRRKLIYSNLVAKEYQTSRLTLTNNTSSIPYKLNKLNIPNPETVASQIIEHSTAITSKLPAHIWHYQIRLTYNALPFDIRIQKIFNFKPSTTNPNLPFPCHLCGEGADSLAHVYGDCRVAVKIKTNLKLTAPPIRSPIEELQHWLLGFKRNPRNDDNIKTIVAGWAIWCESRKRCFDTPEEAIEIIEDRISEVLNDILVTNKKEKKKINKEKTKINRETNFRKIDRLLSSLPTTSTIIFTDGSARPNPGPCGAGAFIIAPTPTHNNHHLPSNKHYALTAALGMGTNNKAELWAIGMAITAVMELRSAKSTPDGEVHLFVDSKYAIQAAEGTILVSQDLSLTRLVRRLVKNLRRDVAVTFHWVKGHNGIDGNERADLLAEKGMRISAKNNGHSLNSLRTAIKNAAFYEGVINDHLDFG